MTQARVHVHDEHDGRWRRLVLAAPPGNLLSLAMVHALEREVAAAAEVPRLRWLTVEGAGGQFSYGAAIPEHLPAPMREVLPATHRLVRRLLAFPSPTAALVEGRCLGGGFELALCCDDIIAVSDAVFALPEIALAAFPPVAAALLPVKVGASRASRTIVTGVSGPATSWHEHGLVTLAPPHASAVDAAREWFVRHLAERSAVAVRHAALASREVWRATVERALDANEARYLEALLPTSDAVEGIRAWMEKRPPIWRDD